MPCTCNAKGTTLNTARRVSEEQTRTEIEGDQLNLGDGLSTNTNDTRIGKRTLVFVESPSVVVFYLLGIKEISRDHKYYYYYYY